MNECRICRNAAGNSTYLAREMMYGLRDEFTYFQCAACGCLQIQQIPSNLAKYYPQDYWAFQQARSNFLPSGRLERFARRQRAKFWIRTGKQPIARLFAAGHIQPRYFNWLRRTQTDFDARILDIGCGLGDRLMELSNDGFTDLTGADPFIQQDITYSSNFRVYKQEVDEITGTYDLIMLHHSFEHMPEPLHVMRQLNRLCRPGGHVLIRIPLVSSFAWRTYGIHWVQLDAPRHLYLHSEASMRLIAENNGFEVRDIRYDSEPFQFWGSEQYVQDIPLYDERSYDVNPEKSHFSPEDMERYRAQARALNEQGDGDQAAFYLYKPASGVI